MKTLQEIIRIYENKIKIIMALLLIPCALLTSCASSRFTNSEYSDLIRENQRTVGRIENAISSFDREIGTIEEQSRSITDRIERIIFEFEHYRKCIDRLCESVQDIRREIEADEAKIE